MPCVPLTLSSRSFVHLCGGFGVSKRLSFMRRIRCTIRFVAVELGTSTTICRLFTTTVARVVARAVRVDGPVELPVLLASLVIATPTQLTFDACNAVQLGPSTNLGAGT